MVDLIQIKTFTLVLEKGSLAAAAKEMKISAAAVSKQLTKLESELGIQLLIRSTRHLEVTEMGKAYYEQCLRILKEVEVSEGIASQFTKMPQGTLKVLCTRHFASTYIIPHVKEFLTLYPQIELTLEIGERIPDLVAESIDVLIGMSIPAGDNVVQRKIAVTRYLFCASPTYLKQFGKPKKPQDLLKHRYITHTIRKPDNALVFGNKITVNVKPYIRVNDIETMLALCKNGLGIIKSHEYAVSDLLKKGILIPIFEKYTPEEIPLYVAYPQRRFILRKIRCFIDFIESKINA